MRKFTKFLALVLVCTFSVFAFAACGGPSTNIDTAAANLTKNGFAVATVKQDSFGATTKFVTIASTLRCSAQDIEAVLQASKGDNNNMDSLLMVWFVSVEAAQTTYETNKAINERSQNSLQNSIDELKARLADASGDAAESLQRQLGYMQEELAQLQAFVFGVSSNVFYRGSSAAVKAAS